MSSTTKKMHVRANCEGRFSDLEQIYSYSFVIPVRYIYLNGLKALSLVMLFTKQNEAESSHF